MTLVQILLTILLIIFIVMIIVLNLVIVKIETELIKVKKVNELYKREIKKMLNTKANQEITKLKISEMHFKRKYEGLRDKYNSLIKGEIENEFNNDEG